jgi:hypothetical protein
VIQNFHDGLQNISAKLSENHMIFIFCQGKHSIIKILISHTICFHKELSYKFKKKKLKILLILATICKT